MQKQPLQPGDIVQIRPDGDPLFAACFMTVTEPKGFGAQGYILIPKSKSETPGVAYYRCKFEDIELVGHAEWVHARPDEESETDA